ncbi:amidohydrolase family protein, partial [Candidatus Entotheonella palauensis]
MIRDFKVIDADGHILEPRDIWDNYMDPQYRDRAPFMFRDTDGKERLNIDGKIIGGPRGLGRLGAIGLRDGRVPEDLSYDEGRPGGFDPHERIKDLDLDGIDAAFLYPSVGLFSGAIDDPDLAAAMCRAYNRWLVDYCKPYPDRLFPVAMLPMQSIEYAIEEIKYAKETLGINGGFLRPNPYNGKMAGHRD